MAETFYIDAIREAMQEEMARDERVFLIGEDVGLYGGAFKTSAGLIERFERTLIEDGTASAEELLDIQKRVRAEVDAATDEAERSPMPRGEDALGGVFA